MRIAAVTINWNQALLTQKCVASLAASQAAPDWIIVIDNGSREDPTELVRAAYPQTVLLRHPPNLGFAAPANSGIQHALDVGADAVLLMNNDAVLGDRCIAEL